MACPCCSVGGGGGGEGGEVVVSGEKKEVEQVFLLLGKEVGLKCGAFGGRSAG